MRYVKVKVRRDVNTVYCREVPVWEIPVLEVVFEDPANVEEVSARTCDGDYPEAGAEFSRLVKKYGADPESGIPYAAIAYGNGRLGIGKLATLIAETRQIEAQESKPVKESAGQRGRPRRAAGTDAMLG